MILGIETSCDETGIALYNDGEGLVDQCLYSQASLHAEFGGVVPELASRNHLSKLFPLLKRFMQKNSLKWSDISAIAYTAGPGLIGALMVGAALAKALTFALGIPLLPINHLEGHLLTPFIERDQPIFPFLGLLVSGGHTLLVLGRNLGNYQILGETLDDAVGEVFDKVAKKMGFFYPGGAKLATLARKAGPSTLKFPIPMQRHQGLDFSFSGLKTFAINYLAKVESEDYGSVASAFQEAVVTSLISKTRKALKQFSVKNLVLAGGVSANQNLREAMQQLASEKLTSLSMPSKELCGDNGAMIAYVGNLYFKKKRVRLTEHLLVYPRLALSGTDNRLKECYEEC